MHRSAMHCRLPLPRHSGRAGASNEKQKCTYTLHNMVSNVGSISQAPNGNKKFNININSY